jgi:hypothetical protein
VPPLPRRATTDSPTPDVLRRPGQLATRGEPGYRELGFAAVTLAGAQAWRWVFSSPASGRISVPGYHVDFFRRIAGGRYATLGVGPGRGTTTALARRVAGSITAR